MLQTPPEENSATKAAPAISNENSNEELSFEGGSAENSLQYHQNTRLADFLTLKVGSTGKETKLQEIMQFGTTKRSRREPSDLDKFLNTKYSNTMNNNSFDNT